MRLPSHAGSTATGPYQRPGWGYLSLIHVRFVMIFLISGNYPNAHGCDTVLTAHEAFVLLTETPNLI